MYDFADFNELLPQVKEAIDSATFIAIDGEFTGLNNGPDVTIYDRSSGRILQ